jgi:hypothetical protein
MHNPAKPAPMMTIRTSVEFSVEVIEFSEESTWQLANFYAWLAIDRRKRRLEM